MAKTIELIEAKRIVLDQLAAGAAVKAAMAKVNRSVETYRSWRKEDAEFREAVDKIREALDRGEKAASPVPDFPEFCEKYLGKPLPNHHLRIWDVVCGREPRDFRESMQYQPGSSPGQYMMINIPPDHAKSTVWTVNYSIWRICRDPNVRIIIVSKSQKMAKKFLSQIKFVLSNPSLFPELHAAFAPSGGWKNEDKSEGLAWREDMIYVRGRTAAEKDPTVEALGIGGQIYGARSDLIILDDIADIASAGNYEAQAAYIGQEVFSRLDKDHGQLLVSGTRVGVMDIYRFLRENASDEDGNPFYTYFAQPAVLDGETLHSSEWEVLWPERLSAKKVAQAKAAMTDPRRFVFVYQQRDVSDHAVFPWEAVEASINRRRYHGPMVPFAPGHRDRGMEGLYVVGSWDPASSSGYNAMIVAGTDRQTKRRWVLDVWNQKGVTSRHTIPKLKELTEKYDVREWRIEKNAVQQFITQLPEIRDWLAARGSRLTEHSTTSNKYDPNMGVEGTLAGLFMGCVQDINGRLTPLPDGTGPIELPSPAKNKHVTELAEQLKSWEPDNKRIIQDLVMALWFAELGLRQYLRGGVGQTSHMASRWTTRAGRKAQVTLSVDDLRRRGNLYAV